MSDTFIPTTDAVRTYFGIGVDEALAHFDGEEQFDRWLAAHDAKVYQRGREDAAQAVSELLDHRIWCNDGGAFSDDKCDCGRADCIAAARGDGEQA